MRLTDLDRVIEQIGSALATTGSWHLVMLTSTVPPGTTEGRVIPRLEQVSGKRCGTDFGVAFSPEFLREGCAIEDYRCPAKTVVGASDPQALECAAAILRPYASRIVSTGISVAEMAKLTDNSWHALKIAFANEIGRFCHSLDIDNHAVMEIFNSDTRLNISPAYLEMVLKDAELVIVAQANPAYARVCELVTDRPVLDLSGAARPALSADNYQGLSW